MPEKDLVREQNSDVAGMDRMSRALHDLCQPLTTLQCRLEIAQLSRSPDDYRDAVRLGLVECDRLIDAVAVMREIVRTVRSEEDAGAHR